MSRFKKAEKAFTCLLVVLLISSLSHADYISGVTASSNDPGTAGYGPGVTVDGAGWIDNDPADDVHVANDNGYGAYLSSSYTVLEGSNFGWPAGPYYLLADGVTWDPWELYLEFDLGGTCDLEDMYIWNGNQTYPTVLGRGFGVVDIAVSNDGGATYTNTYTALSLQDARVLNPGLASGDYFTATDILDLSGITADHVRIVAYPDYLGGTFNGDTTPGDPWDHPGYNYQMSEVRFAGTVAGITTFSPYDSASDVPIDTSLIWSKPLDYDPSEYKLYLRPNDADFSDTASNIIDGDSIPPVDPDTSVTPPTLANSTEYFWRVDSNDAGTWHESDVWSFTTVGIPCPSPLAADLDGDCQVTLNDLTILADSWLWECRETFEELMAKGHGAVVPAHQLSVEWWATRHQEILDRVQQGNVDIIFLGDSITHGWIWAPNLWEESFGTNAVNMGFSGDGTQHVLWRMENGEIDGISPEVAVVLIGVNNTSSDTPEQIADGIKAICLNLRKKLPETEVLLLGIFPARELDHPIRETIIQTNIIASEIAHCKMIHYLDIGNEFLLPNGDVDPALMPDLIHPNGAGYQVWAEAMAPLLAELMVHSPDSKDLNGDGQINLEDYALFAKFWLLE